MTVIATDIPDVLILEPHVFSDHRGMFYESYNQARFDEAVGGAPRFVQDNRSISSSGVLRGLHYQIGRPQGKLVGVTVGEIFDVVVDLRRSSRTFGRWTAAILSEENRRQLWIPEGFAHGFLVLSPIADVSYKVTDYYVPEAERTIVWNDPTLAIAWPIKTPVILSPKDAAGARLEDAEVFR